ncbi:oligopeptide:H+ symporter [uncultured Corynebacterium sp.]|uniref:peptide MFS transporter n=1 Tax=uncultured Corynebacterium sp. TaxID=159447 RepID=UPI0025EE1B11|nr:oligopeptide:H+ symporter [uncultured Corynebacterium sp.]
MLFMTQLEQRSIAPLATRITLPTIAAVETWERFSFYGMQAILAFYLYATVTDGGLGMDKTQATALVGAYGSLLYLFTFVGGWVADRVLGAERTLLTGAALLMCGHLALSLIPGYVGLVGGLLPLALGSGLLKTAAITILGAAFPPAAGARDGAFQVFYLGINIGAFFGPMLTGWLAQTYTYHVGFLAAAALMALGCITYGLLRSRMRSSLDPEVTRFITVPANPIDRGSLVRVAGAALVVLVAALAALATGVLTPQRLALGLLLATVLAAVWLFASMLRSSAVSPAERTRVIAFIPLFLCSTAYWTLQSQTYGVLAVYSDERLNRTVGSLTIPAAWTQSLNPLYILVFSIPLAALLARRANRGMHRQTLMGGGITLAGAGMFLLLPFVGGGEGSTPFVILAGCILAMSLGELFIGPIGMAASASHAPQAFATRFSALYFLTMAIGTSLAGSLSTLYDPTDASAERTYILLVGAVPVVLGAALLLSPKRA